jgi:hypothetical protein
VPPLPAPPIGSGKAENPDPPPPPHESTASGTSSSDALRKKRKEVAARMLLVRGMSTYSKKQLAQQCYLSRPARRRCVSRDLNLVEHAWRVAWTPTLQAINLG